MSKIQQKISNLDQWYIAHGLVPPTPAPATPAPATPAPAIPAPATPAPAPATPAPTPAPTTPGLCATSWVNTTQDYATIQACKLIQHSQCYVDSNNGFCACDPGHQCKM